MVLAADAGNTNIKLAVFDGENLKTTARLPTDTRKTPEEYSRDILDILREGGINAGKIEAAVVSTVVPEATKSFLESTRKLFLTEPLLVDNDTRTGIVIKTDVPCKLGTDRLVDAAAAFHEYGGPLLVIDFGTATTYDVITERGELMGGVIAPGIGICAEALWEKTAELPKIAVERPGRVLGTNTVSSMKSGIYYGCLGQVEYFVRRLKEETCADFTVVATGGWSDIFRGNTEAIDIFEPDLTLKGLNYIGMLNGR
jgi:type III pantothenate kinase